MPVLLTRNLGVTLADGERRFTLRVPELALEPGEAAGLTGASGTGKTMLLELLGLLRRPEAGGRLLVGTGAEARDLVPLWSARGGRSRLAAARGRLFGFVPQSGGLMPFLTVAQNVALGQRISGREDAARAAALIARLGLGPVAGLRPDRLSIGQRQRVSIARALAHGPRIVIADEPTAALDPEAAAEAMALLIGTAAATGAAVLVSSHDHDLLDRFALTRHRLVPEARDGHVVSTLRAGAEAAA
uniref:ABC transporter domain-containing protein n=1 Tax=Cereibacter sphaeroides (strain ATCC 17025 / ATH 2.4.3) TaxID=349102 RepID=A4WZU4_CERS5